MRKSTILILFLCFFLLSCDGKNSDVVFTLDKDFPQDCRQKHDVDNLQDLEDIKSYQNCLKENTLKVFQIIVFKKDDERFYKAKNSHITYKTTGTWKKNTSLPFVFLLPDSMWKFYSRVSKIRRGESNLTLIGTRNIEEYLQGMSETEYNLYFGHEIGPKNSLYERLQGKERCLYGRQIEDEYIVSALAIVRYDPDNNYTEEEQKDLASCLILSFPYFLGANDIFRYRDQFVKKAPHEKYGVRYFYSLHYLLNKYFVLNGVSTNTKFREFSKQISREISRDFERKLQANKKGNEQ